ncbi:MAG TPA: hypothetical protein DDW52_01095 [Planctomycetaceae bacterium]|nr:hypothetical protein [Planctomycetaceae bacterium]
MERRTIESEQDHQTVLRIIQLESALLASGQRSQAEKVVQTIETTRAARIEDRVLQRIQQNESKNLSGSKESLISRRRRLRIVVAIAATLLIAVTIRVVIRKASSNSPSAIAKFTAKSTTTQIFDGQTIRTSGSMDSAEIFYDDGTVVTLLGDTALTVSNYNGGGKQIVLSSGLIQADVSQQPAGLPVRISTPTATMEVLGTTLGVKVGSGETRLEVASGLVALTRKSDGQRVEVGQGKFAQATRSATEQLHATALPKLKDSWSLDFTSGLPAGWQTGTTVNTDGQSAVRATGIRAKDTPYAISTHNAWQEGQHALFAIQPDSVLHIQFRQERYARIRVMVAARVFPAERGRFGANYFYTRKAWNEHLRPGEWSTLSIPLSNVDWHTQRRKQRSTDPDLRNMAGYLIQVATEEDIDLTIKRMWVTNGKQ